MSHKDFNSGTIAEYEDWKILVDRTPNSHSRYYLLLGRSGTEILFYSRGVAWDDNVETRAARPVKSDSVIKYYKEKKTPVLILETTQELNMWLENWTTVALVEIGIWQELDQDLD